MLQVALSAPSPMAAPSTPAVTPEEVLALMARIPAVEVTPKGAPEKLGGWEKRADATAIAAVISTVASSRRQAGRMALFAALESGNNAHAVGDGGEAHGAWQLHGWCGTAPLERQARCWVQLEEKSEELCAALPLEERTAALVSGNCAHGRVLARRREALLDRILAEVFLPPAGSVAIE